MSDPCEPMRGSALLAELSWQVFHGALHTKSEAQRRWCNCVITVWASKQCQCSNLMRILDGRQIGDGCGITCCPADCISLACDSFADMMNAFLNPAILVPKNKTYKNKICILCWFSSSRRKTALRHQRKTLSACLNCQIKINLLNSLLELAQQ